MKSENQVCTLEQAKRLKELGVVQHCLYGYIEIPSNGMGGVRAFWKDDIHALIQTDIILYSANGKFKWGAYTVAELGVMLPGEYMSMRRYDGFVCEDFGTYAEPNYRCDAQSTEAISRAAMLIHLIENELVTVEEINNRLLNS